MEHNLIVNNTNVFQTLSEGNFDAFPDVRGASKNFPFRPFVPIEVHILALEEWPILSFVELTLDEIQDNVDRVEETWETDPLLALAGTLKLDDISESDPASPPEIRVVKGAHEDNPDPLLALAGTLQSDVTDISERHDDYIAAALLVELRGDEDE